eukprot:COSAG06_NODE_3015_length_5959_cov_59.427645_4_plen_167_part_00
MYRRRNFILYLGTVARSRATRESLDLVGLPVLEPSQLRRALPSVEHLLSCHPDSRLHKCSRILYFRSWIDARGAGFGAHTRRAGCFTARLQIPTAAEHAVYLQALETERQQEEAALVKATEEAEKELQSEQHAGSEGSVDVSQKRKQREDARGAPGQRRRVSREVG